MRKFIAIFILTSLSLFLPGQLNAQKTGAEKQNFDFSSRVTDQDGNPLGNARIYSEEGAFVTRTGPDGYFTVKAAKGNPVLIEADGYSSRLIENPESQTEDIQLILMDYQLSEQDMVHLPFRTIKRRNITGAVTVIDPTEILRYDANQDIYAAINGRVPGMFGNQNVYGMGAALIVVDGIPRPVSSLNLQEIEQITVLKDPATRLLYGAKADLPVILVTTKRGQSYKKELKVRLDGGIMNPISYPKYLNASDYMSLYNEALVNDGKAPIYDSMEIANTRNHVNNLLYPDESYYNSEYLKDYQTFHHLIAEASGGNDIAKYYVYMGWKRQNSLPDLGKEQHSDRINLRGNADYRINDYISMRADGVAIFDMNTNLKNGDFWQNSSTFLPNQAPVLIPLSDSAMMANANLINGRYVPGGTSIYQQNIYGNQVLAGYRNTMNRILQINTGLDFDLGFITEGLTASAYLTFDVRNYYESRLLNTYAVYEPVVLSDVSGADSIAYNKVGLDVEQGSESIINPDFYRRIGLYGTLNYHRLFGEHEINAVGVAYRQQVQLNQDIHQLKDLHFGVQANYSFRKKYIAQLGAVMAGSPRFSKENQYAVSPAVGFAWVLSEEDFIPANVFNYLKIRADWGLLNTDQGVADYYLYQTTYGQGSLFTYNNGIVENSARYFQSIGNPNIDWVKRSEYSAGFEALMLNRSLNLEANYFHSRSYDELTSRTNYYPDYLGNVLPLENYNSHLDQGVEMAVAYNTAVNDLNISIGANVVYAIPKVLQTDELNYEYDYLIRTGKPTDAMFGWVAEGLFANQTEIENHATQTFGAVQPGDIKYKDLNDDGIIDDNDVKVIGYSSPRIQYALHLNLRYKAFELFLLGTGQNGESSYFNNAYYWVYGDRKYSEEVLGRWTPEIGDKGTATYPRLSSSNNSNNFRNSTYWIEKNNWFTLHRVQLTMTLPENLTTNTFIQNFSVYLRAANLVTISSIREKRELNIGTEPQFRTYAIGFNASF